MVIGTNSPEVHHRLVYVLPIVLGSALCLVTATAWWRGGPDLSTAYSVIGTGLVGLVVNPRNTDFQKWWYGLVLAIVACAATGTAMIVEAADRNPNPAAAFAASLAALAGLFVDSAKLMPAFSDGVARRG